MNSRENINKDGSFTVPAGTILSGSVKAPASKSETHRLLICAALSNAQTVIRTEGASDDAMATVRCLNALGADISFDGSLFSVIPIKEAAAGAELFCGESGSTLRFLLPVATALTDKVTFTGCGRLPSRPLSPLYELLAGNGVSLSPAKELPLICNGHLKGNAFTINGGVSSQFISGLLFAAPVLGGGEPVTVEISGRCESAPYIKLTKDAQRRFGIGISQTDSRLTVSGTYRTPGYITVGGDWSAAAFWLAAGAAGQAPVTVTGLDLSSVQGDRAVLDALKRFGALIHTGDGFVTSSSPCGRLECCELDFSDIPDLVPALALPAALARGTSRFTGISRLRTKESDRIASIRALLSAFGVSTREEQNDLYIDGAGDNMLFPAEVTVDSFGDHRIAMAAAVMAALTSARCTIAGASCTAKSYPAFFGDFTALGGIQASPD